MERSGKGAVICIQFLFYPAAARNLADCVGLRAGNRLGSSGGVGGASFITACMLFLYASCVSAACIRSSEVENELGTGRVVMPESARGCE